MSRGSIAGYSVVTQLVAPTSTALTTLARVHTALRLGTDTSNDDFFTMYIPIASDAIATYCSRVFGYATWQDIIRPNLGMGQSGVRPESDPLVLANWPPSSVLSIVETVATTATTLTEGVDFEVNYATGQIYRLNSIGNPRLWRADNVTVQYVAGYALPGMTGVPAGISPMPGGLEQAVIRLLSIWFNGADRDPALEAEAVAGLSSTKYWVAGLNGGPLPPEIQNMLDGTFRAPSI